MCSTMSAPTPGANAVSEPTWTKPARASPFAEAGVVVDCQQRCRGVIADALVVGVELFPVGRVRPRERCHQDGTRIALAEEEGVEVAVCERSKRYRHRARPEGRVLNCRAAASGSLMRLIRLLPAWA